MLVSFANRPSGSAENLDVDNLVLLVIVSAGDLAFTQRREMWMWMLDEILIFGI
jgi:hypothetical protein